MRMRWSVNLKWAPGNSILGMWHEMQLFLDTTGFGFGFSAAMAGLALGVIVSRLGAGLGVRVVAGQATDARVVGVVA